MVESLKELNKICQKPRYRETGNWMVRNILRDLALPITWLLLHTPITANQVTAISLLLGVVGVIFFAFPGTGWFLAGAILLQIWYLLDHVDGQIARYRKTSCLTGRFFDFVTHHLIHGIVLFSLGFYGYQILEEPWLILWGFVASMAMTLFNLLSDTKYKTFFESVAASGKTIRIQKPAASGEATSKRGTVHKVYSLLHKLSEIHVLMNLLTLFSLVETFSGIGLDFRFAALVFYGITVPVLTVVKITYLITKRKIDEEFDSLFSQV